MSLVGIQPEYFLRPCPASAKAAGRLHGIEDEQLFKLPPNEIETLSNREWMPLVSQAVLSLPNAHTYVKEIFQNPSYLIWAACKNTLAGLILNHCLTEGFKHLQHQPQQFKIGVTRFPKRRFKGTVDMAGYEEEGFKYLLILHCSDDKGSLFLLCCSLCLVVGIIVGECCVLGVGTWDSCATLVPCKV